MLELGWGRLGSAPARFCSQILHSQVILRLHPWLCPWRGGRQGVCAAGEQRGGDGCCCSAVVMVGRGRRSSPSLCRALQGGCGCLAAGEMVLGQGTGEDREGWMWCGPGCRVCAAAPFPLLRIRIPPAAAQVGVGVPGVPCVGSALGRLPGSAGAQAVGEAALGTGEALLR